MVGIYKITNLVNGKCYIGQSNNIKRRFVEHKNLHRRGCRLVHAAIQKYGVENFSFEVLEECELGELDEREIFYISKLNPAYNIASGGSGNPSHTVSEEVRQVLREKAMEYWNNKPEEERNRIIRENLTGPRKGHPVSEETKDKLRRKNVGKKQPMETIEKRKQTMQKKKESGWKKDPSGNWKPVICLETGEVFPSLKAAAEAIGANPCGVSAVLKNRQSTCRGFHFQYAKV